MDKEIYHGRARGRARGRPVSDKEDKDRRPGVAPSGDIRRRPGETTAAAQQTLLHGRGRAGAAETVPIQAGRSKPKSGVVPHLTSSMRDVNLSSSSSDTGSTGQSQQRTSNDGDSGDSNGNGEGAAESPTATVGRGMRRGNPKDTIACLRTIPSTLETKKGTKGKQVMLAGNFFCLKKMPEWVLYQYRVDMSPDIDYTKERKYHLRQGKDKGIVNYFFDGTVMITTSPIGPVDREVEFISKRRDETNVKVTVRFIKEVPNTDIQYLQFLNIIVRSLLEKLNLDKIGRNYYDSKAKIMDPKLLKSKLELYPGYVTSIRQHEQDILLGVEISHKVLRTDTVYDMIRTQLSRERGRGDPTDILRKKLLGEIVITKYNNQTYKISDVTLEVTPKSTFDDKSGGKTSYLDYYKNRWGFKIEDPAQPMLIAISKEKDLKGNVRPPVYLVPELCNMTGLSEEQRGDFNLMRDLGEYTRQGPAKKTQALMGFSRRIANTPEIAAMLSDWNMEFDTNLKDVPARVLPCEEIFGDGSKTTYQEKNADWGNCFRSWKVKSTKELKRWALVFPQREANNAKVLWDTLKDLFRPLGMTVSPPKLVEIADTKIVSYMNVLNEWAKKKPQLIMVIIPNKQDAELYGMIKRKLCVDVPQQESISVPSQVVTGKIIAKPKGLKSVATKIALQMNCKIGGELWSVNMPLKNAMVVGFDTYHDSQQKGKSVGALVASVNASFTQFFSVSEFHDTVGAQEISNKIASMFTRALSAYSDVNGTLPEKVFFFRDGVGDGQIRFVHETEVQALKAVLKQFNPEMKLTVIIVSKRINTRFVTKANNADNPVSGTVVDDVVTLPERYDFFLVSQSVNQGTVNPTSYNVIWDESGFKPDHLQMLSYKLTHLYFNWPGTVRVPAPVQYAHKLAYLVGTSIHANPSEKLSNLLYYL